MAAVFPTTVPTTAQLRGDLVDNLATALAGAHLAADTTLLVDDTTDFPSAGLVSIRASSGSGNVELCAYTGKTAGSLTGVTRNFNSRYNAAWNDGDLVELLWAADHHNHHVEETIAIGQHISSKYGLHATAIRVADGSASAPTYSFSSDTDSGFFWSNGIRVCLDADTKWRFLATGIFTSEDAGAKIHTAAGDAATPGYAFDVDPDSGVYRIGADSLGISTAGVLRLQIDSTAIASTNTVFRCVSIASANFPEYSFIADTNTGLRYVSSDTLALDTGGVDRLTLSTALLTSTVPMTITTGGDTKITMVTSTTGNWVGLNLQNPGTSTAYVAMETSSDSGGGAFTGVSGSGLVLYHGGNFPIYLITNDTVRLTIAGTGEATFTGVIGGANGTAGAPSYTFSSATTVGLFRASSTGLGLAVPTNGTVFMYANSVEQLRFDFSGSLAIWSELTTKTMDLGVASKAFDDVYADDFQNVADIPFFDFVLDKKTGRKIEIDDIAIVRNIKPLRDAKGEVVFNENGHAYWDDSTLPDFIFSRDKRDPSKLSLDPDGKPWVSMKVLAGLALGVSGQIIVKLDDVEDRLSKLEEEVATLKAA